MVAHDFATPISTSICYLEIAMKENLNKKNLRKTHRLVFAQMNLLLMLV